MTYRFATWVTGFLTPHGQLVRLMKVQPSSSRSLVLIFTITTAQGRHYLVLHATTYLKPYRVLHHVTRSQLVLSIVVSYLYYSELLVPTKSRTNAPAPVFFTILGHVEWRIHVLRLAVALPAECVSSHHILRGVGGRLIATRFPTTQ